MDGKEKLVFDDNGIYIEGPNQRKNAIIHDGERNLMRLLASIATKNGGDILEIGFGLHMSADKVQETTSVTSHTIIEVHPDIYKRAIEWSKTKNNVEIILGNWVDIIPKLNKKFDGIIHDTHIDNKIDKFLDICKDICKEECIVAFFYYYGKEIFKMNKVTYKCIVKDESSMPYLLCDKSGKYELLYCVYSNGEFMNKNIYEKNQI